MPKELQAPSLVLPQRSPLGASLLSQALCVPLLLSRRQLTIVVLSQFTQPMPHPANNGWRRSNDSPVQKFQRPAASRRNSRPALQTTRGVQRGDAGLETNNEQLHHHQNDSPNLPGTHALTRSASQGGGGGAFFSVAAAATCRRPACESGSSRRELKLPLSLSVPRGQAL